MISDLDRLFVSRYIRSVANERICFASLARAHLKVTS